MIQHDIIESLMAAGNHTLARQIAIGKVIVVHESVLYAMDRALDDAKRALSASKQEFDIDPDVADKLRQV